MSALSKYVKVEKLPSSKGIADVIFIPRSNEKLPAMIVELRWNKTAGGAIEQIKKKSINYDDRTGEHTCEIEKHE